MIKIKNVLPIFFSIIFIFYTLNSIDVSIQNLEFSFININFYFFFILFFIPIHGLLSLKYKFLINKYKKITFKESVYVNLVGFSYSLILPMKGGDFFRQKYFKSSFNKNKFQKNIFLKINIAEKIISLIAIILLIFISLTLSNIFKALLIDYDLYIYLLFTIFVILSIFIISLIKKKIIVPISKIFIFDILIWLLQFYQIYLIFLFFNIDLNFPSIVIIFGLAIICGTLPISIGGFGVRDYVILSIFLLLNLSDYLLVILMFFNLRYFLPAFIAVGIFLFKFVKNDS